MTMSKDQERGMTYHFCAHCCCDFGWEGDTPAPRYCADCLAFRDECRRAEVVDRQIDEYRECDL